MDHPQISHRWGIASVTCRLVPTLLPVMNVQAFSFFYPNQSFRLNTSAKHAKHIRYISQHQAPELAPPQNT